MNAPIYEQLSAERGVRVPERPTPRPRNPEETAMAETEPTDDTEGPNEPCCGHGRDDDTDEET